MYETSDEQNDNSKTIYFPLDTMEMNKENKKTAELHDLRDDIEYIKYISTSTCVACNINMIALSLCFVLL